VALLDLLFVLLVYKELKLSTFDAGLAAASASPLGAAYRLMLMVALTAVASSRPPARCSSSPDDRPPGGGPGMLTDRLH